VAVMYLGKIAEMASSEEIYGNPKHPYTRALLSAIPIPDPQYHKDRIILKGDVPSPISPPTGCYFHPRCPVARENCKSDAPNLRDLSSSGQDRHDASCHYS
jgi:peptide/nickel transport system ATP-binding protein